MMLMLCIQHCSIRMNARINWAKKTFGGNMRRAWGERKYFINALLRLLSIPKYLFMSQILPPYLLHVVYHAKLQLGSSAFISDMMLEV